jgi:hypothetical protein
MDIFYNIDIGRGSLFVAWIYSTIFEFKIILEAIARNVKKCYGKGFRGLKDSRVQVRNYSNTRILDPLAPRILF